jgi:hypothetical protein
MPTITAGARAQNQRALGCQQLPAEGGLVFGADTRHAGHRFGGIGLGQFRQGFATIPVYLAITFAAGDRPDQPHDHGGFCAGPAADPAVGIGAGERLEGAYLDEHALFVRCSTGAWP